MLAGLRLNPSTYGLVEPGNGTGETKLQLRAFAPGRSFRPVWLGQDSHACLFQGFKDWLAGGAEPIAERLDQQLLMRLIDAGVLLGAQELESRGAASAGPELGDGRALCRAFCPAVGATLDGDPIEAGIGQRFQGAAVATGFHNCDRLLARPALDGARAYYRALFDRGLARFEGDPYNRFVVHNDPVGRHLLAALTPVAQVITETALEPSYCFAARYAEAGALPPHVDRDQCEYTLSLYLDYTPDPGGEDCPWALWLRAHGTDHRIVQQRGGGLLFPGRRFPHWREALAPGHTATMLFLHWVDPGFTNSRE